MEGGRVRGTEREGREGEGGNGDMEEVALYPGRS